jgi:hypothetical protein
LPQPVLWRYSSGPLNNISRNLFPYSARSSGYDYIDDYDHNHDYGTGSSGGKTTSGSVATNTGSAASGGSTKSWAVKGEMNVMSLGLVLMYIVMMVLECIDFSIV